MIADKNLSFQAQLISRMRRSDIEDAAAVAYTLDTCSEKRPCRSASCLRCGTRFQKAAVSVVEQFINGPSQAIRGRKHALTIIPPVGCVAPDALTVEACERVAIEIGDALKKLNLPPIVMGLEVSFNEDATGKVEPHWCIHPHGIGLDWLSADEVGGLQAIFPASALTKRPIHCVPLDNNIAGILYANKTQRFRRVTYLKTDHPTRKPYRDTKCRALRAWQAVNLAVVEHELGFDWRLLTHGIDREVVRHHLAGLGWPRDSP